MSAPPTEPQKNESGKPKRKFWRFHLSTAFLLMVFEGVVLGCNVMPRRMAYVGSVSMDAHRVSVEIVVDLTLGNPKPWYLERRSAGARERDWEKKSFHSGSSVGVLGLHEELSDDEKLVLSDFPASAKEREALNSGPNGSGIVLWSVFIKLLLGNLVALIMIALVSESIIRRREARKP